MTAEGPEPDAAELVAAWAARVRANREQSERVREAPEAVDFYAPVTALFVADPRREDDPTLNALLELARRGETWLDVGAGAGRFALPLALRVGEVIALDPSTAMLAALREGMEQHGIRNIRPIEGRWPIGIDPISGRAPRADVALIAHVGYDVEAIGGFLDALEESAGRLCVAVLSDGVPSAPAGPFWPIVHGEGRVELPALGEFLAILRARGRHPSVALEGPRQRGFATRDALVAWLRNQLVVAAGSPADRRLVAELARRSAVAADGSMRLVPPIESRVGVASWAPGPGRPSAG